jgi:Flp pilus assembly protein TadG
MGAIRAIASFFRRRAAQMARRGRSGSAALEFAFVAPVLLLFIMGIIETGILFFADATLQNATDDVGRLIRTGQLTGNVTATTLRDQICGDIDGLISWGQCTSGLQVDLRVYDSFSDAAYPTVTKADGSIDPTKMTVQATADCKVILMRVYYTWSIITPLMAPLLENSPGGNYVLNAAAAFRSEPYLAQTRQSQRRTCRRRIRPHRARAGDAASGHGRSLQRA